MESPDDASRDEVRYVLECFGRDVVIGRVELDALGMEFMIEHLEILADDNVRHAVKLQQYHTVIVRTLRGRIDKQHMVDQLLFLYRYGINGDLRARILTRLARRPDRIAMTSQFAIEVALTHDMPEFTMQVQAHLSSTSTRS